MASMKLHHVSVVCTDLNRSLSFYRDLFGLEPVARPEFSVAGAWLDCGGLQLHLVVNPSGTLREGKGIDNNDGHLALRTEDFEAFVERAIAMGYRESDQTEDPNRILVIRKGLAGFPQAYLLDPDKNVIEVNAAS